MMLCFSQHKLKLFSHSWLSAHTGASYIHKWFVPLLTCVVQIPTSFTIAGKCCVGRQCLGVSADCAFLLSWKQRNGRSSRSPELPPPRHALQLQGWPPGPAALFNSWYPVLLFCCWAVQDDRLGSELWLSRVLSLPRLVRKTQFGVIQIPNLLALLLPEIWEKESKWWGSCEHKCSKARNFVEKR